MMIKITTLIDKKGQEYPLYLEVDGRMGKESMDRLAKRVREVYEAGLAVERIAKLFKKEE